MSAAAFDDKDHIAGCIGCAIANKTVDFSRGIVFESAHCTVAQDYQSPIPGFLIVGAKRHVSSVLNLTPEEQQDFWHALLQARQALAAAGFSVVRLFHTEDSAYHLHVWLLPHEQWMDEFGVGVEQLAPVWRHSIAHLKTPEQRARVYASLEKIRAALQ